MNPNMFYLRQAELDFEEIHKAIDTLMHGQQHNAKNKSIPNLNPHYTNRRFESPQTVWVAKGYKLDSSGYVSSATYNYSDRIRGWDRGKHQSAWEEAKSDYPNTDSAAFIELYLRKVLDKPMLSLVHVMAAFNTSGYPYQVFGYISEDPKHRPSNVMRVNSKEWEVRSSNGNSAYNEIYHSEGGARRRARELHGYSKKGSFDE